MDVIKACTKRNPSNERNRWNLSGSVVFHYGLPYVAEAGPMLTLIQSLNHPSLCQAGEQKDIGFQNITALKDENLPMILLRRSIPLLLFLSPLSTIDVLRLTWPSSYNKSSWVELAHILSVALILSQVYIWFRIKMKTQDSFFLVNKSQVKVIIFKDGNE